jgi:insulysin
VNPAANGLRILLISDTDADKAAASLNVDVGNFCDPTHLPGLAHFCEHMLFLGTRKYPDENAYKAYLARNGGKGCTWLLDTRLNYACFLSFLHAYLARNGGKKRVGLFYHECDTSSFFSARVPSVQRR